MKRIVTVAFLFFALSTLLKAQPSSAVSIDPNAPELKFEKDTINYGVLENKANGWRTLKIKNVGKSPLIIQNVHGECGCTTADSMGTKTWTTAPIAPGKTGFIKVHYATERTGIFQKKVFVDSNSKEASMTFYIKGEIKAPGEKVPVTSTETKSTPVKQAPKRKTGTAKKAGATVAKPAR